MNRLRRFPVAWAVVAVLATALGPSLAAPEVDDRHEYVSDGSMQGYFESGEAVQYLRTLRPSDFEPPFDDATYFKREEIQLQEYAVVDGCDPTSPTIHFPLNQSKTLAAFESISYCRDLASLSLWNCTRCQRPEVAGFVVEDAVYDASWDVFTYVGYFPAWNATIVSIRGTNSHDFWNWVEDFDYWRSKYPLSYPGAKGAKIHSGFYKLWAKSALKANTTAAVQRLVDKYGTNQTTYVIGHSMGGAMADLAALWLKFNLSLSDVRVTTFGQPRTGNNQFSDFFGKMINHSWRFTHARDIVPSLPYEFLGYYHTAREIWQRDTLDPSSPSGVDMTYRVCDGSGEDPTCHNSVCHYGACTSIEDHMMYLGYPMYTNGSIDVPC
ncbi:unnamed protein product [Ostreobium quekettii]|uniref:Fungal lipase-type domain-containing protein n=1 Tax=Ostreobium quekettii TaxID=121088 RepID=A0A8S1J415_9CHLO|nr:unnamed protein product [Ostreobium quekettii]|eukprot:evm.model.scf_853EXC.2 EVM.evm.TU.scf_853EXC.2   scf_853EXC:5422-11361(-)